MTDKETNVAVDMDTIKLDGSLRLYAAHTAEADHATEADSARYADEALLANRAAEADEAGHASEADSLTCGDVGDSSTPVYFADGKPQTCDAVSSGGDAGDYPKTETYDMSPYISIRSAGPIKSGTLTEATLTQTEVLKGLSLMHLDILVTDTSGNNWCAPGEYYTLADVSGWPDGCAPAGMVVMRSQSTVSTTGEWLFVRMDASSIIASSIMGECFGEGGDVTLTADWYSYNVEKPLFVISVVQGGDEIASYDVTQEMFDEYVEEGDPQAYLVCDSSIGNWYVGATERFVNLEEMLYRLGIYWGEGCELAVWGTDRRGTAIEGYERAYNDLADQCWFFPDAKEDESKNPDNRAEARMLVAATLGVKDTYPSGAGNTVEQCLDAADDALCPCLCTGLSESMYVAPGRTANYTLVCNLTKIQITVPE